MRITGWSLAAALFLLPLVAMQFTSEVNWTKADFATFGAMLLLTGVAIEITARLTSSARNRLIAAAVLIGIFILVLVELAVGIFH